MPRAVPILLLVLALLPLACKKKPKAPADAGPAQAAPATPAPATRAGEGRIRWPIADLRESPDGRVLAKVRKGAPVAVLARREGWTQVRTLEGKSEGWVPAEAVEGAAPAAAPATAAAPAASPAHVRLRPRRANLRDSARGRIIAKLPRGTILTVLRDEGEWLEVEGGGKKGWIARQVVDPVAPGALPPAPAAAPSPASLGTATVRWKTVNLREGPDGNVLGQIPRGTRVPVEAVEPGWLRVRAPDGRLGWIVERSVDREGGAAKGPEAPAPTLVPARRGRVAWPKVNLRSAPKGSLVETLPRGTALELLGEEGGWHKVRAGDREGWVVARAVERVAADAAPARPAAGPMKQVVFSTVNLREAPRGKVVDRLARGTRLREVETQGDWSRVQTLDGQRSGWVVRRSLGAAP